MGEHDELENRYASRFESLISQRGLVLEYRRDRAGIDTGLHLFARGDKTTARGVERPYWRPLASRVWFQLKGVHESTLSAEEFASADHIAVPVGAEHLKYWFAAPEAVYLVVYVEAADVFIGMDVRELVEIQWRERFYEAMRRHGRDTITVHIPTAAVVDADRIPALNEHRSMRIDGPAFRGRPLGHRIDPVRSCLARPPLEVWRELVERLLQAHDFVEESRHEVGELSILHGVLRQTLLWQSPAFAEYGWIPGEDFREEPRPEQLVGYVCVILDGADARSTFTTEEERAVREFADAAGDNGLDFAVFLRNKDLSGAGGLWRQTLRGTAMGSHYGGWRQLGLEALTYLVLVSTLVYLDSAADLDWDHANYLPES